MTEQNDYARESSQVGCLLLVFFGAVGVCIITCGGLAWYWATH